MPFETPLIVRALNPRDWILEQDLVYRGAHDCFTVPAGFTTDFATVPWWSQSLIPRTGAWTKAAVVHDYLCEDLRKYRGYKSYPAARPPWESLSGPAAGPRDTDGIFRRIMREQGVDPIRRWIMWAAVRWAALFNPARRAGWWRDLPAVLAITLAALAFLAGAVALVSWVWPW